MTLELLYALDGYKLGHAPMLPPKTEFLGSNFTPRFPHSGEGDGVVYIGLQPALQQIFMEAADVFFSTPRETVLAEYGEFVDNYAGVNVIDISYIESLHKLGFIPLEFSSLPEGSFVPYGVPCFLVKNTVKGFAWLVNHFESIDSCMVWGPTTSATSAFNFRKMLDKYAAETSDVPEFVDFQAHDFSMRGMWGMEAAAMSGIGHLANFTGTDNIPSIRYAMKYYDATGFIGAGVPATEHSIMCAGMEAMGECASIDYLLDKHPDGILSVVADTKSIWVFIQEHMAALKDKIMARNGTFVVRPDSGTPELIINGDPDAEPDSPEFKGVFALLDEIFGHTVNSKGYKVLDSHVAVIYGDSITYERGHRILEGLKNAGWATAPGLVLGLGSFWYTYVTRDTHGFAMKATWATIDGVDHQLFKDPVTGRNSGVKKKSAKGHLVVVENQGRLQLMDNLTAEEAESFDNLLQPVWRDGKFLKRTTLDEIRERVKAIR